MTESPLDAARDQALQAITATAGEALADLEREAVSLGMKSGGAQERAACILALEELRDAYGRAGPRCAGHVAALTEAIGILTTGQARDAWNRAETAAKEQGAAEMQRRAEAAARQYGAEVKELDPREALPGQLKIAAAQEQAAEHIAQFIESLPLTEPTEEEAPAP